MSEQNTHGAAYELQREATDLRISADALRQQAVMLDFRAAKLEQRLERLGLHSFYCGSLEREREGKLWRHGE